MAVLETDVVKFTANGLVGGYEAPGCGYSMLVEKR
jgi:hypothetical protein